MVPTKAVRDGREEVVARYSGLGVLAGGCGFHGGVAAPRAWATVADSAREQAERIAQRERSVRHQRRLARRRGGEGEAVSSWRRVNMKLISTCQLAK